MSSALYFLSSVFCLLFLSFCLLLIPSSLRMSSHFSPSAFHLLLPSMTGSADPWYCVPTGPGVVVSLFLIAYLEVFPFCDLLLISSFSGTLKILVYNLPAPLEASSFHMSIHPILLGEYSPYNFETYMTVFPHASNGIMNAFFKCLGHFT